MVPMVRKQVYIQTQQQKTLKRLSQLRGLSEAELIRQAIDCQIGGAAAAFVSDPDAWVDARAFMLALSERGPATEQPRDWRREDLYEERVGRHGRDPD
jgi:hypothetical protein